MNTNIKLKEIINNIIKIFNNIFSTFEDNPINDIIEIIQPHIIIKIIKEIEPEIEILTSSKFNETEFNDESFNINNELINILFIIEKYIEINKDKEIIKDNFNLNKLNILKLSKKDEKNIEEYIKFCEMIICTCYLSDRKDFFIDYIGKLDEETLDFFINIIEKYFTITNNEEIQYEYDIKNDIYNDDDKNGNENNINGNIITQSSATDYDYDDKKNINRSLQIIRLNSLKNFRKINGSGNFTNKDKNMYKKSITKESNISKTSFIKLINKRASEDTLNELNFSYLNNSEKFNDENNKEHIKNSNSSLLKIIDKKSEFKSNIKIDNKNYKYLSSKNIIFSSNFENKTSEYEMKSKSSFTVPKIEMFSENNQKDIIMTSGFKNIIRKSFFALNKGKIDFFLKNGLGEFMKDITNQINVLENKLEVEIEKRINLENTNEKMRKLVMKEKEKYDDLNLRFSLIKNENNKVELLKSDFDKEREEKEKIRKELRELLLEIEKKRIYYEKIEENYKRENKELQNEIESIKNCIPEYKIIKKENETLKKNLKEINKKLISEDRKEMENRLLSMSKNIDEINKEKMRLSKRVQVFSKELIKKGEKIKEMKKSIFSYKKSFAEIKRSVIFDSCKDIINNLKSDENFQYSKQSRQKSTFLKKDSNFRDDFVITEENSAIIQTNNSQDSIKDENQEIITKKEHKSRSNSESKSNNESSFDSLSNNEIEKNNETYFSFDEINYKKKKTIQKFRKISSLNDNEDGINCIGSQLNLMKLKSAKKKAFNILPSKKNSNETIFTDDFDDKTISDMNIGSIFNKINELKNKTSRLNSINTVMSFVKAENFTINNIVDGILKIRERNLNLNTTTNPIKTSFDYEKNEINILNEEIKDLKLKLKGEELKNINISMEFQMISNEKDKLNNQINEKLLEIDNGKIELNKIKNELKHFRDNYFQLEFNYNEFKKKSFESQNKLLNENFELNKKIEKNKNRDSIINSKKIVINFDIINQIDLFISGNYNQYKELNLEITLLKNEINIGNEKYQELENKINIIENSKMNLIILFQDEFEKIKYNHILEVNKFKLINSNLLKNYNEIKTKIEEFEINIKN